MPSGPVGHDEGMDSGFVGEGGLGEMSVVGSGVGAGMTRPAALPFCGLKVPKIQAGTVFRSLGNGGREPRFAHRRMFLFFFPTCVSSERR